MKTIFLHIWSFYLLSWCRWPFLRNASFCARTCRWAGYALLYAAFCRCFYVTPVDYIILQIYIHVFVHLYYTTIFYLYRAVLLLLADRAWDRWLIDDRWQAIFPVLFSNSSGRKSSLAGWRWLSPSIACQSTGMASTSWRPDIHLFREYTDWSGQPVDQIFCYLALYTACDVRPTSWHRRSGSFICYLSFSSWLTSYIFCILLCWILPGIPSELTDLDRSDDPDVLVSASALFCRSGLIDSDLNDTTRWLTSFAACGDQYVGSWPGVVVVLAFCCWT